MCALACSWRITSPADSRTMRATSTARTPLRISCQPAAVFRRRRSGRGGTGRARRTFAVRLRHRAHRRGAAAGGVRLHPDLRHRRAAAFERVWFAHRDVRDDGSVDSTGAAAPATDRRCAPRRRYRAHFPAAGFRGLPHRGCQDVRRPRRTRIDRGAGASHARSATGAG